MEQKPFDKMKALDELSKLSEKPVTTPSDSIRYMNNAMKFLQDIHDNAYEAGFQDCLNKNIPK